GALRPRAGTSVPAASYDPDRSASPSRGRTRRPSLHKLFFDAACLQFAEHVVQQRAVTAPDLLELDAHAEIIDEILHLCLEREADVEDVQHQAKISAGT